MEKEKSDQASMRPERNIKNKLRKEEQRKGERWQDEGELERCQGEKSRK